MSLLGRENEPMWTDMDVRKVTTSRERMKISNLRRRMAYLEARLADLSETDGRAPWLLAEHGAIEWLVGQFIEQRNEIEALKAKNESLHVELGHAEAKVKVLT